MTSSRTGQRGGGVYRASVGMWSADLQMLRRPIVGRGEHSGKGTLDDSSGGHKNCQISTQDSAV